MQVVAKSKTRIPKTNISISSHLGEEVQLDTFRFSPFIQSINKKKNGSIVITTTQVQIEGKVGYQKIILNANLVKLLASSIQS